MAAYDLGIGWQGDASFPWSSMNRFNNLICSFVFET